MNINLINDNGNIQINLEGWLDTSSSPKLGEEIEKINSAASISLNFDNVEYISSSGVRVVVAGYRKAKELGAEYSIKNVSQDIMNIFKLTQIDKKINILAK